LLNFYPQCTFYIAFQDHNNHQVRQYYNNVQQFKLENNFGLLKITSVMLTILENPEPRAADASA